MTDLYYLTEDESGAKQISEIEFDPIPIGDKSRKSFYVQNQASDKLNIDELSASTDGPGEIKIKNNPEYVEGNDFGEVLLEAAPIRSEQLRGLKAEITIEASAILKP